MNKSRLALTLAVLLAVTSCGHPPVEKHIPELLDFVPSDAIAVASYDRSCEVLTLLDSASTLHKINYGRIRNAKSVLSLCYTTSLVPLLAIDAGKATADTSENIASILAQADSLGVKAEYIHDDGSSGRRGALVLSTSQTTLAAAKRHFTENASILDAPFFKDALNQCCGSKEWIIFRNGAADKYIPRSFLMNFVPRREFISFLQKCAEWTTLAVKDRGQFEMGTICGDFDTYYTKVIEAQECGQSKLEPIIPRSTEFALTIPIRGQEFRQAYERWLDSSVKLEKYHSRIKALKEESGKSPLDWEKELDIREVAVVKWNNRSVALVRAGRSSKDEGIAPNPWRGFIPALYGSAFAISDDSSCARTNGWLVFGGEDDLNAFLLCEHGPAGQSWQGKHTKLIVYKPGFMLNWEKEGLNLNIK